MVKPPITHDHRRARVEDDHRLVFPAQALAEARQAARRGPGASNAVHADTGSLSDGVHRLLADGITETLDRMQSSMDALREDVANYKFPAPDSSTHTPPPRAA